MKILMVSAEYARLAKTGGLADAVAGLADALATRGHDVRTIMPGYGRPLPSDYREASRERVGAVEYIEARRPDGGPPLYLVEADEIGRDGRIYAGDDRDAARFYSFSRATLHVGNVFDWRPDVIHCHDWHASLVPALARRSAIAATPSVLTLHNAGYQGAFARSVLPPDLAASIAALEDTESRARDYVVFLALGIRHASAVTTVSPTYAREVRTPELGHGLDALLRARGGDFVGILNGVDYSLWSPESDPFLDAPFARGDRAGKRHVKQALCAELGLDDDAPLVGAVTRLVEQKGIDLLVAALPDLIERTRARFAILGSGEPQLEAALAALADAHPKRLVFRSGYDEALAHRIIAGSDVLVVPSRYEPCGLTQLYAMRYGTIPVVRNTGGLADTVAHFDPSTGAGTGSVFEHADARGLVWGLTTALGWHADPDAWRRLTDNAIRVDFSWARQSGEYEALYHRLIDARGRSPAA
jgi:starch synthase